MLPPMDAHPLTHLKVSHAIFLKKHLRSICNYRPATGELETRCDVRLVHQGAEYKGLWGWRDCGEIRRREATKQEPPKATSQAAPMAGVVPKAVARPKRSAPTAPPRPSWEQVNQKLQPWYRQIVPHGLRTWHGKEWPADQREPNRRRVAPVAKLFQFIGKTDLHHIGEKVKPLKRRYEWDDDDCFKAPRTDGDSATASRKKGASEEWVATELALEQIYKCCKDR